MPASPRSSPARAALAAAGALVTLAGAARGQAPPAPPARVRVEVAAGLTDDGAAREGWAPFEVTVEGGAVAAEVDVELTLADPRAPGGAGAHDDDPRWRARRRVELLPGQRRRLWFVAPVAQSTTVRAAVRDPAAGPDAPPLALAGPRGLTVEARWFGGALRALVVGGPDDLQALAWLLRPGSGTRLGLRPPAELPPVAEAYAGLAVVVVRAADLGGLSAAQADALVGWVEAGGLALLVAPRAAAWFDDPTVRRLLGGRAVRAHPRAPLLPLVDADGAVHTPPAAWASLVEVDGAASIALGRRALRYDGAGPAGARLAWLQQVERGRGAVWVAAADLGVLPFAGWSGAQAVGEAALEQLERRRDRGGPGGRDDDVALVAVKDAPPRALVALLVVAYVLLVGPLNERAARRRGAPLLLVATIPLVALGWTLVVFAAGYALKGGSAFVRRATVLLVDPDGRTEERTLLGVRAAAAGAYDVRLGPDLLARRLARRGEWLELREDLRLAAEGTTFAGVPLSLWSQAAFSADGARRGRGGLRLRGATLENGTAHDLAAVVVLGPRGPAVAAGPVPAGGAARLVAPGALELARWDLTALAARLAAPPATPREDVLALLREHRVAPSPGAPRVVARLARPPSPASVDGREGADREALLLLATPAVGP